MKLIINSDDFGLSKSITDGIITGINGGYITSTTIMSNMEYAKYAIDEAIKYNINCIGLHINMTLGIPIIYNKNLVDENGTFLYGNKQIENDKLTYEDAYNEIMAQIDKVYKYSNGLINIDHLDTHHYLMTNKNINKAIKDISRKLNIPVRNEDGMQDMCPDILYKDFTIDNVSLDSLLKLVSLYKDKDVVVELIVHAGYIDEYTKSITSYLNRDKELSLLKKAKDDGVFDDIDLISFNYIKG